MPSTGIFVGGDVVKNSVLSYRTVGKCLPQHITVENVDQVPQVPRQLLIVLQTSDPLAKGFPLRPDGPYHRPRHRLGNKQQQTVYR